MPDKWSEWLAATRFGGDSKTADMLMRVLTQVGDHLLKNAGLEEGKVVLDVGAGEGLIGFGALELVGTSRVIFSEISQALLDFDRSAAEQMEVLDRCSFVKAAAEDLSAIESESIDLVTTRSVLIYVDDKPKALREFFRMLKPGGRTPLIEPIDDQRNDSFPSTGEEELGPILIRKKPGPSEICSNELPRIGRHTTSTNTAMVNFNERDLVQMSVAAGFAEVRIELYLNVAPFSAMNWDA